LNEARPSLKTTSKEEALKTARGESVLLLYNLFMNKLNKRAKKRVKEAIEKGNLERDKARGEKNHPAANDLQQRRGFLPKPAKKRG
jgi:hypothetical protein